MKFKLLNNRNVDTAILQTRKGAVTCDLTSLNLGNGSSRKNCILSQLNTKIVHKVETHLLNNLKGPWWKMHLMYLEEVKDSSERSEDRR